MTTTGDRDGAGTLREAARLIRSRAEVATPGPWTPDPRAPHDVRGNETRNLVATTGGMVAASENTDHIASFASPTVALAVADWLDYTASYVPRGKRGWTDAMRNALAVATAYLNGGSP